jgi:leucyl aminopeptidase
MTEPAANTTVRFQGKGEAPSGVVVLLVADGGALGDRAKQIDSAAGGWVTKAMKAAAFKGAKKATLELLAVPGTGIDRLLLVGIGDMATPTPMHWTEIGGVIGAALAAKKAKSATLLVECAGHTLDGSVAADLGFGAQLRRYTFTKYRTGKTSAEAPSAQASDGGENGGNGNGGAAAPAPLQLTLEMKGHKDATEHYVSRRALAEGITFARDLVNEPANMLSPAEFADRLKGLTAAGVEVEILDEAQMIELGMHALLAVNQGSSRPARLGVLTWNGAGSPKTKPIAFVGKGVVFDTGGISIKPAKGMEDMKGDMAGAACVAGLMHALAARKAKVNAVGIVGLVENMPSGTAMRPGDIIGSMAGRTIEVLNTDAEGRLVLADALHYVQERFKPKAIVDLATLTGAIMVALGKEHAGLFSNNDKLAQWLRDAGEATGERVWRMPMDPAYDKDIDSKIADMKNIGGAYGGAITAAQFLKRFVGDVPWAHLDIAGVAMAANKSDINESWGNGFGIRLLDRLVAEHYEG